MATQLLKQSLIVRSIFNKVPTNRWTISPGSGFSLVASRLYTTTKSKETADPEKDSHIEKKKLLKAQRAFSDKSAKSLLGAKTYNKVMGIVDEKEMAKKAEEKKRLEMRVESNKLVSGTRKDLLKAFETNDANTVWGLHEVVMKDYAANKKLLQNIKYSRWIWDQMIRVCAENGLVKKTFKLYNDSKKIGLKPTKGTLFWLLQACAKAKSPGNHVERCFVVLNEMQRHNVEGNLHFYNLILQTCANERDEENALKIFQLFFMKDAIADRLTGIKEEKLRPDQSTFSSMMSLYEIDEQRHVDFDQQKMMLYWKFMNSIGLKPDLRACNTVLRILRNSPTPMAAVDFYKNEMKARKIQPDLRSLDLLLNSCIKAKDYNAAQVIIENEIERNKDLYDLDTMLYNTILRVYAKVDVSEMEKYFQEMKKNKKVGESTYALMIPVYAKIDRPDKSFALFDEMINNGFDLDARTLNGLVIACDKAGDTKRLEQVFKYMTAHSVRPDEVLERVLNDVCGKLKKMSWLRDYMSAIDSADAAKKKDAQASNK